ncbi:MAG: type IX secretion system plug protein domain-containing protein [Bacteroidota bacterium]|nr:type IX secretion system plug protein domain-containing protein [Bacteroidota bacterium]
MILCISLTIFSCHTTKEFHEESYTELNKSLTENIKIEKKIIYKTQILNPNIKTVLCHNKKEEQSLALINLSGNEKLLFSFDDLHGDKKKLFIHYYSL